MNTVFHQQFATQQLSTLDSNKQQNKFLSLTPFNSQSREQRMDEAPNSTNAWTLHAIAPTLLVPW
jgi:hypothetical protein